MSAIERVINDLNVVKITLCNLQMLITPEMRIRIGQAINSAIKLLEDQVAVKPRRIDGKRNHFIKCGNCNYDLMAGVQFCSHCGRAVQWDG